jgi:hypothetical protein
LFYWLYLFNWFYWLTTTSDKPVKIKVKRHLKRTLGLRDLTVAPINGFYRHNGRYTLTLQKPEGFRVKASRVKLYSAYREPFTTQDLKASCFPRCFKGKQHGKIDPIL